MRATVLPVLAVAALTLTACSAGDVSEAPAVDQATSAASAQAGSGDAAPSSGGDAALAATKITECGSNEFGVVIKGTTKNTTDAVALINITYEIVDSNGDRVDEGGTIADNVRAGQSAKWEGTTLGDAETYPKGWKCRLLTVDVMPSS